MKTLIKNRGGDNISVLVEEPQESRGVVFLLHGMGCNKEETSIKTLAESFRKNNFTTVLFDSTNTFGESDGLFENLTITKSLSDIDDVINWSKSFEWYKEPFILAGHSFGASLGLLFAEEYPKEVLGIACLSAIISEEEFSKIYPPQVMGIWEKNGLLVWKDGDVVKKLKWEFIKDKSNYSIPDYIQKIRIPLLLVVGDGDPFTLIPDQERLEKTLLDCQFNMIKDCSHFITTPKNISELNTIISQWVKSKFTT